MAFGAFGAGPGGTLSDFNVRSDFDLQAIWQLNNLGLGNRALVQQRLEERELAQIESCKVRDIVVKEVTQSWAELHSASRRSVYAERELQQALISARKNVEALGQTKRVAGNIRILVIRPLEAVVALQALNEAYYHYFGAVADYNRAQFELYRALGNPAQALGEERQPPTSPASGGPARATTGGSRGRAAAAGDGSRPDRSSPVRATTVRDPRAPCEHVAIRLRPGGFRGGRGPVALALAKEW